MFFIGDILIHNCEKCNLKTFWGVPAVVIKTGTNDFFIRVCHPIRIEHYNGRESIQKIRLHKIR